jgi:hypothetical protein
VGICDKLLAGATSVRPDRALFVGYDERVAKVRVQSEVDLLWLSIYVAHEYFAWIIGLFLSQGAGLWGHARQQRRGQN